MCHSPLSYVFVAEEEVSTEVTPRMLEVEESVREVRVAIVAVLHGVVDVWNVAVIVAL